ncbi:D-2-hydroxyglutarate dehydrogenase, mitochondrial isoform X2 [Malaya genurostris]|uniref:D-2-hydroxyglutarate dehydrogenase, mitochondrial isoform X2 n=1 Tax=Malaya genurostris TaxID=325434 RepID=UPI0026F3BE53|nr:D-2-hydroxyglutarate dehydrogenase, mitochondrial isoform X2 [Malaya genurostris]
MFNKLIPCMRYSKLLFERHLHQIPLSKDRYGIIRKPFAKTMDSDIQLFKSILPDKNQILLDPQDTVGYNRDYFRYVRGLGTVVLKPRTTKEVSHILRHCNNRRLAISIFGGNTGVCGGSIPVFDEIILSMELMNKIEVIDEYSGILVCQSGCVLEKLEEKLLSKRMIMPLDLGSKGSCQIGGNLATNAGGIRLVRYGNLHGTVLGLEAVLANGTTIDLMSNFQKDNTGYHLKHMFIGSEGTLGVITRVAIACPTETTTQNVLFLGLRSYEAVLQTFLESKKRLGEILTSCELIDRVSLEVTVNHLKTASPIKDFPFYMLLETTGIQKEHDDEKVQSFLDYVIERGIVSDGVHACEPSKIDHLWKLREMIPAAVYSNRFCLTYDLSLPLKEFYDIVTVMRRRVGHLTKIVCGFGHIGDSNIHLTIAGDELTGEIQLLIDPFVYEFTRKLKGSVSAEHGIGLLKPKYLNYSKSTEAITLMKQIKMMMDPNGILNPYKVLQI